MRKFIKYIYKETSLGYFLVKPIKILYDFYRFRIMPDDVYVKKVFKKNLGYELNLENPLTLNEKIQWLKLNDRTSLHTICADKYAVREHIKERIGGQYLIPLLYHTTNPKDITPDKLPNTPFVIKTNHDSGNVTIVNDKLNIDWSIVQKKLAGSLKNNYYYPGREWQYKNIKPRIIVERLLLDENNNIPNDYKLHCFNGKLVFTQVDIGRFENHRRNFYDLNWDLIDCQWNCENGDTTEKPLMMDKMQSLAEELAKDFDYIRVDLYVIGEQIFFGELTFSPESGWGPFSSIEWDKKLGSKLTLSNLKS